MAWRDLVHSVTPAISIAGATVTATTTGVAVDTQFYESLTVEAQVAAISGTAPTYLFSVQDCDTSGGTYAAVDASCYMTGVAPVAVTANGILQFGLTDIRVAGALKQIRRFIQVVCTVGGTTPSAIISALVLLGHPRHHSTGAV